MRKHIDLYLSALFILLFITLSCNKGTVLLEENFQNNDNQWDVMNSAYISNKIENGSFSMSNELNNVIDISLIRLPDTSKNISVSSSIKIDKFYGQNGLAGIILFADDPKNPKKYIFFGVNGKNEVIISQENINPAMAQILYQQINNKYIKNQVNNFSVITHGDKIEFSINNSSIITTNKPQNEGYCYGFTTLDSKLTASMLMIKSLPSK